MVAGIILLWLPALRRTFTVEMATEKTRIEPVDNVRFAIGRGARPHEQFRLAREI
jgi:hypothetical protein